MGDRAEASKPQLQHVRFQRVRCIEAPGEAPEILVGQARNEVDMDMVFRRRRAFQYCFSGGYIRLLLTARAFSIKALQPDFKLNGTLWCGTDNSSVFTSSRSRRSQNETDTARDGCTVMFEDELKISNARSLLTLNVLSTSLTVWHRCRKQQDIFFCPLQIKKADAPISSQASCFLQTNRTRRKTDTPGRLQIRDTPFSAP
jgi:hypothetical protein